MQNLSDLRWVYQETVSVSAKENILIHGIVQGILLCGFPILLSWCIMDWWNLIPTAFQPSYLTAISNILHRLRFPQRMWITVMLVTDFIGVLVKLFDNKDHSDQPAGFIIVLFLKEFPFFVHILAVVERAICLQWTLPNHTTNVGLNLNRVNKEDTRLTILCLSFAATFTIIDSVFLGLILMNLFQSSLYGLHFLIITAIPLFIFLIATIFIAFKHQNNALKQNLQIDENTKTLVQTEENFSATILLLNMIQMLILVAHALTFLFFSIMDYHPELDYKLNEFINTMDTYIHSLWWLIIVFGLTQMRRMCF